MPETEQQRKERNRQEDLQRLRGFRPMDDDFMRCIFKDDIPLAQHVLRILAGKDDLEIVSIETQADMKRLVGARSLCLDAYEGDDAIGILMHDFRCSDPDDMLDDKMAAKTRYFKETEEGVEYMCKAIEDMRNDNSVRTYVEILALLIQLKL